MRLSELLPTAARRTLGVRDIPLVIWSPRRLFGRAEDVPAWGWPLLVQLVLVTLIGYATVETGLIGRELDRQVAERIADIERVRRDVVERSQLREMYEQEHKRGQFEQMIARMRVVVAAPAQMLVSALLIAAVLYGAVAVSGRKPEWHTLLSICVFAGFIEVLRLALLLVLMLHNRTLDVDTSAALVLRIFPPAPTMNALTKAGLGGLLTAADPFRIWYWLVVVTGLRVTMQLPGWRAWTTSGLGWLAGAVLRAGLDVAAAKAASGGPEM
jgi:hypothetical protein